MSEYRYLKIGMLILVLAGLIHPVPVIVNEWIFPPLRARITGSPERIGELYTRGGPATNPEAAGRKSRDILARSKAAEAQFHFFKVVFYFAPTVSGILAAVAFVFFFAQIVASSVREQKPGN